MNKILLAVALASQALIAAAANPLVEMKTSAGTMMMPPPTPTSPLSIPAARPISRAVMIS